jgi:hypothetical protein
MRVRVAREQRSSVDPARAGRILEQVLALAEALPYRRPGRLEYPAVLAHRA